MDEEAEGTTRAAAHSPRLPKRQVSSPVEMAAVLTEFDGLLRARAGAVLGAGPEVDEVIQRTARRMRAIENPAFDHALRVITRTLRDECQAVLRRRRKEPEEWREARARGVPVEPVLGPIEGVKAQGVAQLSPRQRARLQLTWSGWRPREIAAAEHRSVGVVRLAIYNARQVVRDFVDQHGPSAPALLFALPSRLRHSVSRWLRALADIAPHPAAALVPMVACSLWWTTGAQLAPSTPVVAWGLTGSTARTTAIGTFEESTPGPPAVKPAVNVSAAQEPVAQTIPSGLQGAAAETPEDVRVTAAATPPGDSPAVVAIGRGNTCNCPVLLQSLDGAATWTATDGPPSDADQLVLPPDYPRDPRIFAGVSAFSATSRPYVAVSFGAPFRPMTGPPPGEVWLSSHFDAGDPRLFVSALTGVWSTKLTASGTSTLLRQEITAGAGTLSNQVAVLATPPPGSSAAVLAWTPALASVAGTAMAPSPNAAIMACSIEGACQTTDTLGAAPGQLVVSPVDPRLVVAHTRTTLAVSHDGGQSFTGVSLPPGVALVQSAVPVGPDGNLWLSVTDTDGTDAVLAGIGAGWRDMGAGVSMLRTHLASLLPLSRRHLLAVLPDAGYRCTPTGVAPAWWSRCA